MTPRKRPRSTTFSSGYEADNESSSDELSSSSSPNNHNEAAAQARFKRMRRRAPSSPNNHNEAAAQARVKRMRRRAAARGVNIYDGSSQNYSTPYGPVTVSKGWFGQPRVSSKLGNFGGARLGTTYKDMGQGLEKEDFKTILDGLQGKKTTATTDNKKNRQMAMIHGCFQKAEPRRDAAASKLTRSALRRHLTDEGGSMPLQDRQPMMHPRGRKGDPRGARAWLAQRYTNEMVSVALDASSSSSDPSSMSSGSESSSSLSSAHTAKKNK